MVSTILVITLYHSLPLSIESSTQQSKKPRTTTSILTDSYLKKSKAILCLSVDVETAESMVGIVQLSMVAFDYQTKEVLALFDKYINPGDDKREFWNEHSMEVHGIRPTDDHIKTVGKLERNEHSMEVHGIRPTDDRIKTAGKLERTNTE
jgi:hypothetical protein